MTSALLQVEAGALDPKQIIFRGTGYAPAGANKIESVGGTATPFDLTISGVATNLARQSAKADLGALWASRYAVDVAIEFHTAPTAETLIKFYWNYSNRSAAAEGNQGGTSGSDAGYTGYNSDLDESLNQLEYLGFLPVVNFISIQQMTIGYLDATSRYGSLVIVNETNQTLAGTDGIESAVAFTPVIQQGQDT